MKDKGPIYGVELLDSLPLDGGMMQQLPSRDDLESIRDLRNGERIVAGYEVLLEHYYRAKATEPPEPGNCERCGRVLGECDGAVCDACRDGEEVAA